MKDNAILSPNFASINKKSINPNMPKKFPSSTPKDNGFFKSINKLKELKENYWPFLTVCIILVCARSMNINIVCILIMTCNNNVMQYKSCVFKVFIIVFVNLYTPHFQLDIEKVICIYKNDRIKVKQEGLWVKRGAVGVSIESANISLGRSPVHGPLDYIA